MNQTAAGSWQQSFAAPYGSGNRALGEPTRIEQMLRPKFPYRPAESGLELDSEKVPDFTEYAITDSALQFASRKKDLYGCPKRDRAIYLQTRSGMRNVFEIGDGPPHSAILVFPLHVEEIGAKQSYFCAAVLHTKRLSAHSPRYISAIARLDRPGNSLH